MVLLKNRVCLLTLFESKLAKFVKDTVNQQTHPVL